MCSGIPGKVAAIDGVKAEIIIGDQHRWYNAIMQPDLAIGDYVLVYADLVVQMITEQEANEMLDIITAMQKMQNEVYQAVTQEESS